MFEKVLSRLPYNVIWKRDNDSAVKSKNIKVYKWLPQADLLSMTCFNINQIDILIFILFV